MHKGRRIRLSIALAAITSLAFLPVLGNGFVNWDDTNNFLENPAFGDLDLSHARWALQTALLGVYQPLAWIFLECQHSLWGLAPWGYHLVSVLLHAANTVVFFWLCLALLERASPLAGAEEIGIKTDLPVAAAVLLFAVHPLRVETVAWISCQPYLWCTLFSMLSVLTYLHLHQSTGPARTRWWIATFVLSAAAMLCKAIAMTLPLVFLIVDAYPLRRLTPPWRAIVEKSPFAALTLISAIAAFTAKISAAALPPWRTFSLGARTLQTFASVFSYLGKTILPIDLAVLYPLAGDYRLAMPRFFIPVIAFALVTVWVIHRAWRKQPGPLAAWGIYLIVLGPNSGFMGRLVADRYAHVATGAFFVVLAAYFRHVWLNKTNWRRPAGLAVTGVIVFLIVLTRRQCGTWHDSIALWQHAIAHGAADNTQVRVNLASAFLRDGQRDLALEQAREATRRSSDSAEVHYHAALLLNALGQDDEALAETRKAVALAPQYAEALGMLGTILSNRGLPEGNTALAEAIRLDPGNANARTNLGLALARGRRLQEALPHFIEAARLDPGNAETHVHLGYALGQLGRPDEARSEFLIALQLKPGHAAAQKGLHRFK